MTVLAAHYRLANGAVAGDVLSSTAAATGSHEANAATTGQHEEGNESKCHVRVPGKEEAGRREVIVTGTISRPLGNQL